MTPRLAIITVVYNNYDVLKDFFISLEKQTNQNFRVFIADLSTKREVIGSQKVPFSLIDCTNLGYAFGVNMGINHAIKEGMDHFCIINDDVYFKKDFVENILHSFSVYASSLIGGKIYYAPGYEYHKDRYTLSEKGNVLWYAGGTVDWNHAITTHRGVDEVDHGQYNTPEDTGFITGCFMCFDKVVVDKIGNWDTSYFLYYEDADYSERARRAGIPLRYDPTIILWHKNAQSTDGAGSLIHQKYQESSRKKYALKYAPVRTKLHILKNYFLKKLGFTNSAK
jgi:hypothetical protein